MKKLGKPEILFILLTLLCLSFTAGYFTGRSSSASVVTFERLAPPSAAENSSIASGTGGPSAESASHAASGTAAAHISPEEPASAPGQAPASPASPAKEASSGKININTASSAELEELPGIGEVLARNIVEYRQLIGGFERIEQIMEVKGIGEKKFQAIKDMITVGQG